MYLAACFYDRESSISALRDLQSHGIPASNLDVFSDQPLEISQSVLRRPSHMSLAVVMGAIGLCVLTIGFVYFTQHNYKLVTGGMPIFSFWATGVIFYELTMLGAIVTTFVWFLLESGLVRRRQGAPMPEIGTGEICLRVRCQSEQAEASRRVLESAGAHDIRTIGDSL